jgi:predicted nucleic acid-binding protein
MRFVRNILVDTGAMIGLLNPADRFHEKAVDFFAGLRGTDRFSTTWPVITECTFALIRNRDALFDWLSSNVMEVVDFALNDLQPMRRWMNQYSDREVDFAHASLIRLATKKQTNLIATIDFNDFETYRLANRKAFKNLIAR